MSYIPFPDLSPEVFSVDLFGVTFALRWYALAYIAGLLIGWRLVTRALATPRFWPVSPPMTAEQLDRLLTWIILGVVLGGRLGYVLFYQPGFYLQYPAQILRVWEGGMSFHGGFLGVIVAAALFCRREGIPMLPTADLLALATPPGLLLGRLANFVNAELWGRPTTLPWGVAFPGEAAQSCATLEMPCVRHPSQLYEAGMEGLILGALLLWLAFRAASAFRRPGLIAGTFIAGYGLARFLVEFVRQPDAQFITADNPLGLYLHLGGYGLTAGQLLSLPMILAGAYFIVKARRSADDPA
ncbi:Prolipoprotein diacylglyceryl transferase [Gemmobacter caeni]|uniref:Phosphatidylglycerol--prolipoprotein diacylglyceryl transferase n=1 Tax=Gemmobacter caeni TaxID=589035 RepID=A0A2T6B6V7_9RHOB|nr:prolipoprotein diacylglyceryl transferase [Gemmobacter caeni]PTX51762.1 prolipoprotein diacylglyceryl transferase [Gemmobacter caeni]TWJ03890.1 Prolipoprotein diacylglyceryl transferase [Gemmobacter caeni]